MKKHWVMLGLLAALFVLAASAVGADPPTPKKTPHFKPTDVPGRETPRAEREPKRHSIFGTVESIGTNTFTVSTKQSNVVVTVNANTKFHIPTQHNATLADLSQGDRVAVNGTMTGTSFTAKQVSVAPGKPTIQHRVGTVQAYKPNSSITIIDVKGLSVTFRITSETEIRKTGGDIAVGDRVTVVSSRDPSTDVYTARAIVVHPKQ